MSFFFTSLNSGSNGNAYFVGTHEQGLLVDAGLSCKETEKRMGRLGIPMEALKAIFVSHEHADHITGIPALVKKYGLPVYLSEGTRKRIALPLPPDTVRLLSHGQQVTVAGMQVTCFSKWHDAAEPMSFVVSKNEVHVGVFTDIGMPCENLIHYARQCHAMLLESNYCEDLLEKGRYTAALKKRIRGKEGHLSNDQALELYLQCRNQHLKHLVLGHLSQNNNTQEKVMSTFSPHVSEHTLAIASRYKESDMFELDDCPPFPLLLQTLPPIPPTQGRLFD
jgi:phosphoribosyl 1,2-cyclic phosphodiesterase